MGQFSIIIKMTHNCNLHCAYCYEGNKKYMEIIDWRTISNAINKTIEFVEPNSRVEFIWHGGEPLLMGMDTFKKIKDYQAQFNKKLNITNSIQTNGTLLNKKIIDELYNNEFKIGISLDGPAIIHNQQRKYANGKGSFEKVLNNLKYLQEINHNVSVLSVFTKYTYNHITEFYDFFNEHKINVRVTPLLMTGRAKSNHEDHNFAITSEEYGEGLIYLFDRWINEDKYTFTIDPLDKLISSLVNGKPTICTFSGNCYERYLSITPKGEIVPCGRWSPEQILFGDINSDTLETAFASKEANEFQKKRKITMLNCMNCEHFNECHGGCPFSGYLIKEDQSDKDYYCKSYSMIISHIKNEIKNELEKSI